jgi:capsular exopolysaccharide synthesis family protein
MLRTRLMQAMRSNNWRILGVSSLGEDEGKSFTAVNLAISIAAEYGQEALLVDLDLRKPSICETLGMSAEDVPGLRNYLVNQDGDLASLFVNPGIERLGILPSVEPLERSSDLLASPRGRELFAQLRGRTPEWSIVVVDLPPLLAADDALAVAPMLDALLLVVAEGEAEREALLDAGEMLDAFNLVGTVLNKSVEKDSKRSSYY